MPPTQAEIRLVVLDWAGTAVDFGSLAPVSSFIEAFARHKIRVTPAEARAPMGLHKRDHIREMLRQPEIADRWKLAHGKDWTENDVESVFREFVPLQLEVLDQHSELIPGLLETVEYLRRRHIRFGATTGYFRDAARRVQQNAAKQGYRPEISLCPDDVGAAGRPYPWMIFRIMQELRVFPPTSVLKVGDTAPDMEEGRNAGAWCVGVLHSSSEVGLSQAEWENLSESKQIQHTNRVTRKLLAAGAHAVIGTIADLPRIIELIEGGESTSHNGDFSPEDV
jgi:phosphonoacetaldehyde hydrolase